MKKTIAAALAAAALVGGLSACTSSADVASHNLSKEADQFKIQREIVFYNGITDTYVATITGLCSLGNDDGPRFVSVTCKVGPNKFIKDHFFKSDNTVVFSLQTKAVPVSTGHYKVIMKPSTVVPDFDLN